MEIRRDQYHLRGLFESVLATFHQVIYKFQNLDLYCFFHRKSTKLTFLKVVKPILFFADKTFHFLLFVGHHNHFLQLQTVKHSYKHSYLLKFHKFIRYLYLAKQNFFQHWDLISNQNKNHRVVFKRLVDKSKRIFHAINWHRNNFHLNY